MDQLISVGVVVLALHVLPFKRHPLHPWESIGSAPHVIIVNDTDGPVDVWARAQEVDNATRLVGTTAPQDTGYFKLPYADTKVTLYIGDQQVVLNTNKPLTWRIEVTNKE